MILAVLVFNMVGRRYGVDEGEKIQAHIVSVWREAKKAITIGGREGMLLLTDRHLLFIHKTTASMDWWKAITQRQVVKFIRSRDVMIRHDGYGEEILMDDSRDERNVELAFHDILDVYSEEKDWGSVLYVEYAKDGRRQKHQYAIAQDWVKYPVKEPTKYMRVDWTPFVQYVRERQRPAG